MQHRIQVDDPNKMVQGFALRCSVCQHSFSLELSDKYKIAPYWEIPQWKNRLKALVRQHFRDSVDDKHGQYILG